MKLFLIHNTDMSNYDIYTAIIVSAKSIKDALKIHPSKYVTHIEEGNWRSINSEGDTYDAKDTTWFRYSERHLAKIEYLGKTKKKRGVILSSFTGY